MAKLGQKVSKCQTKNFKAQSEQKMPDLTYLALHKAIWQAWLGGVKGSQIRL